MINWDSLVGFAVQVTGTVIFEDVFSTGVSLEAASTLGGHSKETWTDFCSLLTTVLPFEDNHGHLSATHQPYLVHMVCE